MATPGSSPSSGEKRMQDKVVIITGGASGIGEATVRLFVAHGAFVFIGDIQDTQGEALAHELGPRATYIHCDVAIEQDVAVLVDAAVGKHGRLDIMYSNAGIIGPIGVGIQDLDIESMDSLYNVNIRGNLLCMKHAARVMIQVKKGVILTTASAVCVLGGMGPLPYSISKNAIVGLLKSATAELGPHGIRVNGISPTGLPTPMSLNYLSTKLSDAEKRAIFDGMSALSGTSATTADVANAALFLASDEAQFISGHNLLIDGGLTVIKNIISGDLVNADADL